MSSTPPSFPEHSYCEENLEAFLSSLKSALAALEGRSSHSAVFQHNRSTAEGGPASLQDTLKVRREFFDDSIHTTVGLVSNLRPAENMPVPTSSPPYFGNENQPFELAKDATAKNHEGSAGLFSNSSVGLKSSKYATDEPLKKVPSDGNVIRTPNRPFRTIPDKSFFLASSQRQSSPFSSGSFDQHRRGTPAKSYSDVKPLDFKSRETENISPFIGRTAVSSPTSIRKFEVSDANALLRRQMESLTGSSPMEVVAPPQGRSLPINVANESAIECASAVSTGSLDEEEKMLMERLAAIKKARREEALKAVAEKEKADAEKKAKALEEAKRLEEEQKAKALEKARLKEAKRLEEEKAKALEKAKQEEAKRLEEEKAKALEKARLEEEQKAKEREQLAALEKAKAAKAAAKAKFLAEKATLESEVKGVADHLVAVETQKTEIRNKINSSNAAIIDLTKALEYEKERVEEGQMALKRLDEDEAKARELSEVVKSCLEKLILNFDEEVAGMNETGSDAQLEAAKTVETQQSVAPISKLAGPKFIKRELPAGFKSKVKDMSTSIAKKGTVRVAAVHHMPLIKIGDQFQKNEDFNPNGFAAGHNTGDADGGQVSLGSFDSKNSKSTVDKSQVEGQSSLEQSLTPGERDEGRKMVKIGKDNEGQGPVGKSELDLENVVKFTDWPKVNKGRPQSEQRRIQLTNLPKSATFRTVFQFLKGTIEKVEYTPGNTSAWVTFLHAKECKDFYNETANGIDTEGTELLDVDLSDHSHLRVLWVEIDKDVTPLNTYEKSYIMNGYTRCVRGVDLDEEWSKVALKKVAIGKNREFISLIDGVNQDGRRTAEFQFANIKDAVMFFTEVSNDAEFDKTSWYYAPDPCAKKQVTQAQAQETTPKPRVFSLPSNE